MKYQWKIYITTFISYCTNRYISTFSCNGQKSEAYDDISILLESNDFIERGIVEIKWSNDTTPVSADSPEPTITNAPPPKITPSPLLSPEIGVSTL